MGFIDFYSNVLTTEYPDWILPDKNKPQFGALYQLADIFDTIVPQQIKLQELSSSIGQTVSAAITSMSIHGSSTAALAIDISTALDLEVSVKWAAPWLALKTSAALITPTPPPMLTWTSSSPTGTNTIYPDGSAILQSILSNSAKYNNQHGQIALGKALSLFVKAEYTKHGQAGPPPLYPAIG